MKSFFPKFSLVASFLCLLLSNLQTAQSFPADDTIVKHIPTLAALVGGNWSNKQTLYVEGALRINDGFQGLFTIKPTCPLGVADGGLTCVNDNASNHFVRANYEGKIQQAGAVIGSAYDCSSITGVGLSTCTRADALLTKMDAANAFYGSYAETTQGIVIALASTHTLPANTGLTCEAGNIGKNNVDGIYYNVPGTIYLDHSAQLSHAPKSFGYHQCLVVASPYVTASPFTTIRKEIDYWGNAGTAVTNGDTGVLCPTEGCNDSDLMVIGFDTCLENTTSGNGNITRIAGDCNVGTVAWHNLGTRRFSSFDFFPYTTHGLVGVTDGAGSTAHNDSNSEWWTPTGVVNDGSNHCQLQSSEHSTSDIHTGDIIVVSGMPSRESCEGQWVVTKSGSDIILNNSSYTGPTTTGSFTAGRNSIYNIASMANVYPGQTITGVSGITNGTAVISIDRVANFIAVSCGDVTVICVTGNGTSVSIPFANDTASTFAPPTCTGHSGDTCIWLSSQSRYVAGNSNGGVKAGHIGTCMMVGGPASTDADVGLNMELIHCYSYETQLHVQNSTNTVIVTLGGDTEGKTNNFNQTGMVFDGADHSIKIEGHALGKLGVGAIINITNSDQRAVVIQNMALDGTGPASNIVQFDSGSAVFNANAGSSGDILVGHLAGPVFAPGANIYPHSGVFYENDVAQASFFGGANAFQSGYNPSANNNNGSSKVAQTATATAGSKTLSGATLDTTGMQSGMIIVGPATILPSVIAVDTFTAAPCVPSCTVTMTDAAKNSVTGGSFKFKGTVNPPAQAAGVVDRKIQQDGLDAFSEVDAFGARISNVGIRYDGTMGVTAAVSTAERLNGIIGRGYDGSSTPVDDAGVLMHTLDNFTASTHGSYDAFMATQKGAIGWAEAARVESGGVRAGPSSTTSVLAMLTAESGVSTTTSSDIATLSTAGVGDITVGATAGFTSPTAILVDHELMEVKIKSSTQFTVITRGLYSTTSVAHSNGATVSDAELITARLHTAPVNFASFSNGNTWTRGHAIYTGSTPTPTGTIGTGSSIAGNDNAGVLTIGSSPGSGTITITFAVAWTVRPVCFFQDETTLAANHVRPTTIDTTHAVLTSASGSFAASDVISWMCSGYR